MEVPHTSEQAMNTTQHSPESHAGSGNPAGAEEKENDNSAAGNPLDEALDESFPASDPVAISITSIEPGGSPAPRPAAGRRR